MSRIYTAEGPTESSTGPKTAIELVGSTTIRCGVMGITVGPASTPNATDYNVKMALATLTATGTGTSYTPLRKDPAETLAASALCEITSSSEPTYAATNVFVFWINQRATYNYIAQDGREFWSAATSGNGIGIKMVSAGQTHTAHAYLEWKE